jgi:hypothetical protein
MRLARRRREAFARVTAGSAGPAVAKILSVVNASNF